jgi:hypothetical protein
MVGEFLSQAWVEDEGLNGHRVRRHTLVPHLTRLFNVVLRGSYPVAWTTSAVTPVPKPGADQIGRMIIGGSRWDQPSALYAMVLLSRLDRWAEGSGLRARGQAGFRQGRGTADQAFILRHLIDAAAAHQRPSGRCSTRL